MAEKSKIKLVVLPHIVIPHRVQYTPKTGENAGVPRMIVFCPEAEVDAEFGKALLSTYPNVYKISDGKAKVEDYTFNEGYKTKTLYDLIAECSDEEKAELYQYLEDMKADREKKAAKAKEAEEKQLLKESEEREKGLQAERDRKEREAAEQRRREKEQKEKTEG